MDSAIVMSFNEDKGTQEILNITLPIVKRYCHVHEIDLMLFGDMAEGRHIYWSRNRAIKKALEDHETIMYMDADALICNFDYIPEQFLLKGDFAMLDTGVNGVNDGVMIFRRTNWTFEWLDHLWNDFPQFLNTPLQLQDAENVARNEEYYRQHIDIYCPHASFNAFDYIDTITRNKFKQCLFKEGDFILHLAGSKNEFRKIRFLKEINRNNILKEAYENP